MLPRLGVISAATLAAALAVSAQEQDPLRTHYERAQSFQLAGELERAATEYRAEVLPRALRRLGNLEGAEGRFAESIELLTEAARQAPADVEIQIDLAVAWLRKGDLARAGELAVGAVSAAPSNARARSVSGRVKLLAGDAANAAAELRRSLDQEARFDTAFALALANLHLGRLETARALFDQMMIANRTADLLVLIGRAYLEANYPALAVEEFNRALARDAKMQDARRYSDLAQNALATGRPPDARSTRSVLLDLLPGMGSMDEDRRRRMRAQLTTVLAGAWHNLGVIHARRGEPQQAAEARQRAEKSSASAGGTAAPSIEIETAIRTAEDALQRRDTAAAERAITPVIEQRPELPAALRVLGLVRATQGRYDEAEALLRRAVDRDATEYAGLLTLANIYVAREEFSRAITTLERTPSALKQAADAVRLRAYLGLGRLNDVRPLLATVAESVGPDEAADVAEALLARDMTADAEAVVEKTRRRGQTSARLLLVSAKLHLRKNESTRAESLLNEALSLDPGSVDALRLLAQLASARGDDERASDLLRRARELAPDAPDVLRQSAEASVRAARPEDALAAARRLAALRPDDAEARHLLGVTLLQNQNWSEAVGVLASPPPAASADPRWPLALGLAEFGRRNHAAARSAFERALALDPEHVEARFHLGLIAREQGRTAEAIEMLETAIGRNPAHGRAHLAIGTLYLQTGNLGRAQRHLACAAILEPDDPAPHYQLGLLHRRAGDEDAAGRAMQRFQEIRHKSVAGPARPMVKGDNRKGGC